MEKYTDQFQGANDNSINIPHYYGTERNSLTGYYDVEDYTKDVPTLHSVAQTYDQNGKLKEILSDGQIFR
ncbi:hypothetical protein OW763_04125 [Clostridium aestuarii]|uniref:RHS repeat-associated core domain-containing protein n=1 Tax=Clostridium aestuarii TaxID=338193 RepID=A0ABT4CX23_9CLOT|nr:hypothetical protein [Clostridium aestuarii]MCY6483546.1 hypothetical protein [Clostridium aestuarii]